MAYNVKCPSCGLLHTLQESDLGKKLACAQCDSEWVFDEPLKRRKQADDAARAMQKQKRHLAKRAEREEAEKLRQAEKKRRALAKRDNEHEAAIASTRRGSETKARIGKQPQYAMLQVASRSCYVVSVFATFSFIVWIVSRLSTPELDSVHAIAADAITAVGITVSCIVTIVVFGAMGAAIDAFRDIAINSWKSVNKE